MAKDYLFGDLNEYRCDVEALRDFYEREIRPLPSQPYYDNGANYVGWAVTSQDGSIVDGVQRISRENAEPGAGVISARAAVLPTPICKGPVAELLNSLKDLGLKPFRARVMALDDGFEMKLHRDASKESWRLHVPIVTNEGAFFEWRIGEEIIRKHLPADGRAWLVRVDHLHRAVNAVEGCETRVHLLMSLMENPAPHRLGSEAKMLPKFAA